MAYVDGFLLAVPKDRQDDYRAMAKLGEQVWKDHGALEYVECFGDDVPNGELTSFPRAVLAKDDEIVVFAWIVFASKEARDAINKKVMADPRMNWPADKAPFDMKRLIFGGFAPFLGK